MGLIDRIEAGEFYPNPEVVRRALDPGAERRRLHLAFRAALELESATARLPAELRDALFGCATEDANGTGLQGIVCAYEKLAPLVLRAYDAGIASRTARPFANPT